MALNLFSRKSVSQAGSTLAMLKGKLGISEPKTVENSWNDAMEE